MEFESAEEVVGEELRQLMSEVGCLIPQTSYFRPQTSYFIPQKIYNYEKNIILTVNCHGLHAACSIFI